MSTYQYPAVSAHGISSALDQATPEEWKATYNRYLLWIDKEHDIEIPDLLQSLSERLDLIELNLIDENHCKDFINVYLPLIVKCMLRRKFLIGEMRIQIHYQIFFQHVIFRRAPILWVNQSGDLETMRLLLDQDMRFYENELDQIDKRRLRTQLQASDSYLAFKEAVSQSRRETRYSETSSLRISQCFLDNINVFGQSAGFQCLLAILDPQVTKEWEKFDEKNLASMQRPTISDATSILDIIFKNRLNLAHYFYTPYAAKLCDAALKYIKNFTNEEWKLATKSELMSFMSALSELLRRSLYSEPLRMSEIKEGLELKIAFKCLVSEQLEKRIYGIQQIVLKVGHVVERMK